MREILRRNIQRNCAEHARCFEVKELCVSLSLSSFRLKNKVDFEMMIITSIVSRRRISLVLIWHSHQRRELQWGKLYTVAFVEFVLVFHPVQTQGVQKRTQTLHA